MRDGSFGTIYVGAPIEHASERDFLAAVMQELEKKRERFTVLANFHAKNRQVDCVVITGSVVALVEVKSSDLPVRGGRNGKWQRQDSSGDWFSFPNAYLQALGAKNALRDEMRSHAAIGEFYPDASVVFIRIADGRELTTGDLKVSVGDLNQFWKDFERYGGNPWPLDQWDSFALRLGLERTSLADATAPDHLRAVTEAVDGYRAAFEAEYVQEGQRWIPENENPGEALKLAATTNSGCALIGPSGCGKTLMLKWLAVELSRAGYAVIFFAAKDFHGTWAETIRGEVGLLTSQDPRVVLRAGRVGRPLVLVLDGINELGTSRSLAMRGIRALANRFDARIVVAGQDPIPELAGLCEIAVDRPSHELKVKIASSVSGASSAAATEALSAVTTGFEAGIVGQLGVVAPNLPRVALLDQYMRAVLAEHARAALVGLRRLAAWLHENLAFSISEVRFDEFMRSERVGFTEVEKQFSSRLLTRRSGRVSFAHEMLQGICAALAIAPVDASEAEAVGRRLSQPAYEPIAGDIVAAIDDSSLCDIVLAESTNGTLLVRAASGELGVVAKAVALRLLVEAAQRCSAEIKAAELALVKNDNAVRVEWTPASHHEWTDAERARLLALGRCAATGVDPETYLGLCSQMDERLRSEWYRLRDEAKQEKFALRSESFRLAYYGFADRIGFATAAEAARPWIGKYSSAANTRYLSFAKRSAGQMLFLLEHRHHYLAGMGEDHFAEELAWVIRGRFRFEPYHLQLDILDSASFARNASEAIRVDLIEALESIDTSNIFMNSSVIDALKVFNALDDDAEGSRDGIRAEIAMVLSDVACEDRAGHALSLCMKMIDHPFDHVYWEEIHALADADRHRIFRQALGGVKAAPGYFGATLVVGTVASLEDENDVPALRALTAFPDEQSPMPQETWGVFVLATRFLGRHKGELLPIETETDAQACLLRIRLLIYAIEAGAVGLKVDVNQTWAELHAFSPQLVIGCLAQAHAALTHRVWSESAKTYEPLNFCAFYQAHCLRLARRFVEDGRDALFFGRFHGQGAALSFAFGVIEEFGDRTDIGVLRRLSSNPSFAGHALRALKRLDTV